MLLVGVVQTFEAVFDAEPQIWLDCSRVAQIPAALMVVVALAF
jgi:hypothetical protein